MIVFDIVIVTHLSITRFGACSSIKRLEESTKSPGVNKIFPPYSETALDSSSVAGGRLLAAYSKPFAKKSGFIIRILSSGVAD